MDDTQLLIASIRIEIQVVGQTRRGVSRILVWRIVSSQEDTILHLTPDRQNSGPYPGQSLSYFFVRMLNDQNTRRQSVE